MSFFSLFEEKVLNLKINNQKENFYLPTNYNNNNNNNSTKNLLANTPKQHVALFCNRERKHLFNCSTT